MVEKSSLSDTWELIAVYNNHLKDYGFVSDLRGETTYGIPRDKVIHNEFRTEFIEDSSLKPHIFESHVVPRGTLKVYGRCVKPLNYSI